MLFRSFQGSNNFTLVAVTNFSSRLIFVLVVFFFLKNPESSWIYPAAGSLGTIIIGLALSKKHLTFKQSHLEFRRGINFFISNISIAIYSGSSIFWISYLLGTSSVTTFSAAERIIFSIKGMLSLYSQVIYPQICSPDFAKAKKHIIKTHLIFVVLNAIGSLVLCVLAKDIIEFFVGGSSPSSVTTLQIMSFIPLIISINVYAYQWLIAHYHHVSIRNILLFGAIIGFVSYPIFIKMIGILGASLVALGVEILVTSCIIVSYLKLSRKHVPN